MIKQIPVQENNIVAFRATGKLSHADYQAFLSELEQLIEENGRLSVLLELRDFHGWDLAAAWDDFRFINEHENDFDRIAVVGSNQLERWMTAMEAPFLSAEVRFFDEDQLGEAWDWLRESTRKEAEEAKPETYQTILVAVDYSPHTERLMSRALQLATAFDASVHLVHAVDYPIYYDEAYDPIIAVDPEKEMEAIAREHMNSLLEKMDSPRLSGEVLSGSPKGVVLSQSEALNADLIIMGKHGQGVLGKLLGSTTNAVMNHARCEVLSVPLDSKGD